MLNLGMFKYGQRDPQKQSFLIPDLDGLPCRIRHYVESMQMLCHKAM